MTARRIALLGAESTGKTQLAHDLAAHLRTRGLRVAVAAEVLRDWCTRAGRAPRPEEQLPIAQEQEQRVEAASVDHDIVVADTTAMMVAIYSGMLFADGALLRFAQQRQRCYHATLVTGLDLPWVADGLQREGPQVREPVDRLVRDGLRQAGVGFQVVYGVGSARLDSALAGLARLGIPGGEAARSDAPDAGPWAWSCEKCSDPACEHKLFSRLL